MYVLVLSSCNKNPITVLASAFERQTIQDKMRKMYADTIPFAEYVPFSDFSEPENLVDRPLDDFITIDDVLYVIDFLTPFILPKGLDGRECKHIESHQLKEFTKEMGDPLGHYNLGCSAVVSILDCSGLYDEATGFFDWNTFHRTISMF